MKAGKTLQWFGFKQTLKGALIVALFISFMAVFQAVGYKETYPNKAAQVEFAASLKSAPSLGFLYGDPADLDRGVNGYVAYRVISFVSFIVAIWALMAVTKLLRGNEEDGRWEVIRTGAVTARAATAHVATGFFYALGLSFTLASLCLLAANTIPGIALPPQTTLLITLAIFAPAALFASIGVFASQLAITRKRALLYGLAPLLLAYLLRGIGNTSATGEWLLNYTPFGWNQLISPVANAQPLWLVAFGMLCAGFLVAGFILARRDLGSSTIPQSSMATSRFYLLGGAGRLAIRQNSWAFIGWAAITFLMIALVANIVTIAAQATAESTTLSHAITTLASNTSSLKVAFLGAGLIFVVMTLMIMATTVIAGIRSDESKQYLDTILVTAQRRSTWLLMRVSIGILVTLAIALGCGFIILSVGSSQQLGLELWKVIAHSIAITGTVIFLLGFGTLMYGILPRLAVLTMYVVITWAFIIDLISSTITVPDWLQATSLFHYISFNLAAWPDWPTFTWLISLGVAMLAGGIICFTRRDITAE